MSQIDRRVPAEAVSSPPAVPGMPELKIRSTRGVAATLAGQSIRFLLHLISTAVLARLLVPRDFGLVAMVTAVTAFASMLRDMGMGTATIQRAEVSDRQVTGLFWVNAFGSLALAFLLVAMAPLVASVYRDPRVFAITLAIAPSMFVAGLSVQHRALLAREMRFFALAAIDVASLAAAVVVAISAARIGVGYWALVAIPLVQGVVSTALVWVVCPWRPKFEWHIGSAKSMLSFGGNVAGFNVVNYFARNFDDILIGWRWGAAALGFYAKAYDLLLLPLRQINAPVSTVAIPLLSRLQDSPSSYRSAYISILGNVSLIAMPLIAYMIVSADWLILSVLGPDWSEAVGIFRWLALAAFIQVPTNTTGWLFISQDRTRELLRWGVFASVTSITAFLVGLPWGAVGVAAAYALMSVIVHAPLLFWIIGRHGHVATLDLYRSLTAPAAAAMSVFGALLWIRAVWDVSPLPGAVGTLIAAVGVTAGIVCLIPSARSSFVRDWRFFRSVWEDPAAKGLT